MRFFRTALLLAAGECALAVRAATLTNCMELVTYQSRQCYHVVCTNAQLQGIELCIDETGTGWSVCSHGIHTAYVAARGTQSAVSYLDFTNKATTVGFTTNDFYVAFSWYPDKLTRDEGDCNGWVHLRSPDGEMEIVASALSTVAGERCFYPDTGESDGEPTDDPAVDPEASKWEWVEQNGRIILNDCLLSRSTEGAIIVPSTINGLPVVSLRDGILAGYSLITSITLPDTIREIGPATFEDCTSLTECRMPAVTNIGPCAFRGCTVLAAAPLPDGLRKIGDAAFRDCLSLKELLCPATLAEIGDFAFRGCVSLTNVTLSIAQTEIERGVFKCCTSLETCDIPLGIRTIRDYAFGDCTSLLATTVPFDAEIADDAFPENCKVTCRYPWTNVQEPSVRTDVIPSSVSNIEYKAYSCDEEIQSLLIPDWVTNMEYAACCAMMELGAVVIGSGLRTCDSEVFGNCLKLTNVVIRNGCRIVGERMFAECPALTSVTIPPSVREIGAEAFAGCNALKSVTVPLGVQIADNAFPKGCTVTRTGPSVELASCNCDDDRERLIRLVDPAHWGSAFKVNLRMETTESEYDLVKRFSFAGISAARYEMQNDGTLIAYFDKPELQIAELSPTDGQMAVKVSPASGSSIVAPIAVDSAVFVTTSDSLDDFAPGEAKEYCGGYDFDVDTSAYESEGLLRIDLSNILEGRSSQFFQFSLTPQQP